MEPLFEKYKQGLQQYVDQNEADWETLETVLGMKIEHTSRHDRQDGIEKAKKVKTRLHDANHESDYSDQNLFGEARAIVNQFHPAPFGFVKVHSATLSKLHSVLLIVSLTSYSPSGGLYFQMQTRNAMRG